MWFYFKANYILIIMLKTKKINNNNESTLGFLTTIAFS